MRDSETERERERERASLLVGCGVCLYCTLEEGRKREREGAGRARGSARHDRGLGFRVRV